jgi:hypothetical protein
MIYAPHLIDTLVVVSEPPDLSCISTATWGTTVLHAKYNPFVLVLGENTFDGIHDYAVACL